MLDFHKLGSRWIWDENGDDKINQYLGFRKEFELDSDEKFLLHICADTNYAAWLNGELLDFGGFLAYPSDKYYDTLDVTTQLKRGKNVLCVLAYYQGVNSSCYAKGTPGLIFALTSESRTISNEGTLICKGSGYLEGEIPLVSIQLGPAFEYDARLELDWRAENPQSGLFQPAMELEFSEYLPKVLKERPVEKLDISEFCEGKLVAQGYFEYSNSYQTPSQDMQYAAMAHAKRDEVINNGQIAERDVYLLYDFGEEIAGHVEFDIEAETGTQIDIACGEHLDDLRVCAFLGGRNFGFRYTAKEGENKFISLFRRAAGRYLQVNIHNSGKKCKVNSIGLRTANYPLAKVKPIKSSDSLHRAIDEVCVRTLALCMHEHYEDTPWREQCLYAADSRTQALCGYYMFEDGNRKFAKASFDLLGSSLKEDGFLDICAPSVVPITIPHFSFMWIVAVCEYVFFSGEIEAGEVYYEKIKRMLSSYFDRFENGIIKNPTGAKYWHFYEWHELIDGDIFNDFAFKQDFDVLLNLFLYYAVLKAIELAELLGKPEKSEWSEFLKGFKQSINENFYDTEKKRYFTFLRTSDYHNECELAQSVALCCGICPDEKALREQLVSKNDMSPITLSASIFKYEALLKDDSYKSYVINDINEVWGSMLKKGATTFWETIDGVGAFDGEGSLCHGWSAVPAYIFRKYYE